LATGRQLYRFGLPSQSVVPYFSHDGKILAMTEGNPFVHLLDASTGKSLRSLKTHEVNLLNLHTPYPVAGAAFSPDDKTLISAGGDGAIRFWEVATGREMRKIDAHTDGVCRIAMSRDGSRLASVRWTKLVQGAQTSWFPENKIRLWDVASGKELLQIVVPSTENEQGHPFGPSIFEFTPDGKALVTAGVDRILRVWDISTGKELRRFEDHKGSITAMAIDPTGKNLAIVDAGQTIRVRDLASGQDLVPTGGHRNGIWRVAVSSSGQTITTAASDRTIHQWDAITGRELKHWEAPEGPMRILNYSSDGRTLFSAGGDKTVRFWDSKTGKELTRRAGFEGDLRISATSADGSTLAVAGLNKIVHLLDARTGKDIRKFSDAKQAIEGISFSSDGTELVAWSQDHILHRWNVSTGKHESRSCDGLRDALWAVAFSPDGRFVVFGGQKRYLPVVNLASGKEVRQIAAVSDSPEGTVFSVVFSGDGRTLAWAGPRDGIIRLVEAATGQERARFAGHEGSISTLAFTKDGKRLISGGSDTTALVWDTDSLARPQRPPTGQDLPKLWQELVGNDAAKAYRAMRAMAGVPDQTVKLIKHKLHPIKAPDEKRVRQLVSQLDDESFAVREKAFHELEALGELAESALREALAKKPSLELRNRAGRLLEQLQDVPTGQSAGLRLAGDRSVELLEMIGSGDAQELLKLLASGAPNARLTQEAKASSDRLAGKSAVAP
jgi:WD40 repeat protein